jgi:hypothetical protein
MAAKFVFDGDPVEAAWPYHRLYAKTWMSLYACASMVLPKMDFGHLFLKPGKIKPSLPSSTDREVLGHPLSWRFSGPALTLRCFWNHFSIDWGGRLRYKAAIVNASTSAYSARQLVKVAHNLLKEREQQMARIAEIDAALLGLPAAPAARNRKPLPVRQQRPGHLRPVASSGSKRGKSFTAAPGHAELTYRGIVLQVMREAKGPITIQEACAAAKPYVEKMEVKGKTPMASFKSKVYIAAQKGELVKTGDQFSLPLEAGRRAPRPAPKEEPDWDVDKMLLAVEAKLVENPGVVPSFKSLPPVTNQMLDKVKSILPGPETISPEKLSAQIWDLGKEAYQHPEINSTLLAKNVRTIGELLAIMPQLTFLPRKAQMILYTRLAKFFERGPFSAAPHAVEEAPPAAEAALQPS